MYSRQSNQIYWSGEGDKGIRDRAWRWYREIIHRIINNKFKKGHYEVSDSLVLGREKHKWGFWS